MKKLVSIVALVVLAALGLWVAATFWFGVKTEESYYTLLRQGSKVENLRLENESYHRGFWESKARTVLVFQPSPAASAENPPLRIHLAHDIYHGPFPFHKSVEGVGPFEPVTAIIESRLVLNPEIRNQVAELYTQVPELAAVRDVTIISLDGNGEERFVIPPFRRTLGREDPVVVDWKGFTLKIHFTREFKKFVGSFSAPGLEIAGENQALKIREVRSAFNSEESLHGLSLGDASFSLAALEFDEKKENESTSFLMKGLSATTSARASGDTVTFLGAVRADQMAFDGIQAGPGVFELEFRNLDAASLAQLQKTLDELQKHPLPGPPETVQERTLARYMEILPGLLKRSPELELKQLEVKTGDGDFTGKAMIAYDGAKSGSAVNLPALLAGVSAQAEFQVGERLLRRVSAAFMKDTLIEEMEGEVEEGAGTELDDLVSARIEQQLTALTAQDLIVKKDGYYGIKGAYKGGQILLNGRPLQLQELLR
ncbi:MAG TPA: YdgA family protein [Syntrophobacteraceae bacterium]|nr:YdgA family protein [Syntrophobacteraceae bacterium]